MCRLFSLLLLFSLKLSAQHPYKHFTEAIDLRYDSHQPVVNYVLRIDSNDLSVLQVEMHLSNLPDTFRLAMFVHPEYDDRYYRFIEDVLIKTKTGIGSVERLENTLWKFSIKGGEATIFYSIRMPKYETGRGAWRAFLSASGGMIGGPQCYLYLVGAELAPVYVHLQIPKTWKIATGLQATSDPYSFFAPTVHALLDGPILVGKIKQWSFNTAGVPHLVIYWPSDRASVIDSSGLVRKIQNLTEEALRLFGRLPYRDYTFLFQDSSWGALEHTNSVTLGIPSSGLTKNMDDYISEIAHEYFHTWNLMRIRPAGYGTVYYRKPALSKGLWWSEGLTMFYADLLIRRAGLATESRLEHLRHLIEGYFNNPAHYTISAERLSMSAYAEPGFLGDYDGSTHLQGEFFGYMLDILIRHSTNGAKSMDDVMRKMMENFSGEKGFEGRDIEKIIGEISGENVHSFFEDHIRGNKKVDFNKYLWMIGLKANISWENAVNDQGQELADQRVQAYTSADGKHVLLGIVNPSGAWKKAGLMTGDELLAVNGKEIKTARDFYSVIRTSKLNDRVVVRINRKSVLMEKDVLVSGYQYPVTVIEELNKLSSKQQKLLTEWKAGL